jgi:hypothetical protein
MQEKRRQADAAAAEAPRDVMNWLIDEPIASPMGPSQLRRIARRSLRHVARTAT